MDEALIGYARCSTDEHDLTAQREALHALGVPPDRVYIDHGISGTKRERPGLDRALAAVRTGDTLAKRGVSLSLGGQIQTGEYTISDLGELFSVSRPTVYRTISRTTPWEISPPD